MTGPFGRIESAFSNSTTKQTAVGIVIAALFVAALWFGLPHPRTTPAPVGVASEVAPGFVGQKRFGAWILNCPPPKTAVPGGLPAFSLMPGQGSPLPPPSGSASASSTENALGRCRVMLPYFSKANSKQVVMILSFRTIGKRDALALILRFPSLAKKGDLIVVKSGTTGFRLPVQQCSANVCLAAGELGSRGENLLLANKEGVILFPPGTDGKRRAVRIPFGDTARALADMRRAES